ncbi:MAG: hypothetical protein AMXMBFR64_26920 [Myxococcales bacterium]
MDKNWVLGVMAAVVVACGGSKSPQDAGSDQVSAARQAAATLIVPPDEAVGEGHVLYRYPDSLPAGTVVRDSAGDDVLVNAPSTLFWLDPTPEVRFIKRSWLLLVDDAGAVTQVELRGWPVVEGGAWGTDTLVIPAGDVVDDPAGMTTRTYGSETGALAVLRAPLGDGCTRRLLIVRGPPGANAKEIEAEAQGVRAMASNPKMGIGAVKEIDVAALQASGEGNASVNVALMELIGLWLASAKCCDEVILWYLGHGAPDDGDTPGGWIIDADGTWGPAQNVITGAQIGEAIKGAIEDGNGGKFLVVNNSCYAEAFTNGLMGVVAAPGGIPTGSVTVTHSSGAKEPTIDGRAGAAIGGALTGAANGSLENVATFEELSGAAATTANGFTTRMWSWSELGFINNKAGARTHTVAGDPCDRCGNGVVDAGEDCDGPGSCSDGDPCTTGDTCTAQCKCVGKPLPCDAPPPCHTTAGATCVGGNCTYPPGGPVACDDGDPCTTDDTCDPQHACKGTPVSCDDSNPCTADWCIDGACKHAPSNEGEPCDDGVVCTSASACKDGACAPTQLEHLACAVTLSGAEAACTSAACTASGCHYTADEDTCEMAGQPGECQPSAPPKYGTGTVKVCVPLSAPQCTEDSDCAALSQALFGLASGADGTPHPACRSVVCASFTCVTKDAPSGTPCEVGECMSYACNGSGACEPVKAKSPLPEGCGCDPASPGPCAAMTAAYAGNPCAKVICQPQASVPAGGVCQAVATYGECDPGAGTCWKGACTKYFACLPRKAVPADLQKDPAACDDGEPCTTDGCTGPGDPSADAAGCTHTCDLGATCPEDPSATCTDAGGVCGCPGACPGTPGCAQPITAEWSPATLQVVQQEGVLLVTPLIQQQPLTLQGAPPLAQATFDFTGAANDGKVVVQLLGPAQEATVLAMNAPPGQPRVVRVTGGCILAAAVRIHEDLLKPGTFISNIGPQAQMVIGALDAQGTLLPGAASYAAVPPDGLLPWSLGGEASCPQMSALAVGLQGGGFALVESLTLTFLAP